MGILVYYRLNGNSNDYSGNANHGVDTNIVYAQGNGVLNGGAKLTASLSSYIVSTNNVGLSGNVAYTMSFLVNRSAASSMIIGLGYDSANYSAFIYDQWVLMEITVHMAKPIPGNVGTSTQFTQNKWTLITVTKSPGLLKDTTKIYFNGVNQPLHASSTNGSVSITDDKLNIGRLKMVSTTYYTDGYIDEVFVSNVTYTPAQVKNEYSRIKGFF
jgi:hypothetical protein